jgi:HAD superfamily hydrolase (TIGR01549 family)
MKPPKPLISFDLDQTLVKSTKAHSLSFAQAFIKEGIKVNEQSIRKFIDGRHSTEVIISIKPKLGEEKIKNIRKWHKLFLKKTIKFAKPIPRALQTLKFLKKDFQIALVTNCSKQEVTLLMKAAKIPKSTFDIIIRADEVKHPKPWPDEIFKAEKIAKVKSDIHVGDSIYDIIAAKKAKAKSISVLTGQTPRKELSKYHPDYIIKSVAELPTLLIKKRIITRQSA